VDYVVAIPSYRRADVLAVSTLPMLLERGVPIDRIYVFVGTDQEIVDYHSGLPVGTQVVKGAPGMAGNRNAIARYFPDGAAVCQFDDDITDVRRLVDAKTTAPVMDLDGFIQTAFEATADAGLSMWGVYPTLNPFWMSQRVTFGLRFLVGCMWGVFNRQAEQLVLDEKEDYERTLRRWSADGGVVRFDYVAPKNRTYKTPGGCQASHDRIARSADSAAYLMAQYPGLVALNPRRKGAHTEILLKEPK